MGDFSKIIVYNYKFIFSKNLEKNFKIEIDKETLNLVRKENISYPEWTELECYKCLNCPLEAKEHPYCLIAKAMYELIDSFKELISYQEVDIVIDTEARTYMKHVPLQQGLTSLIGIYMVTSGCPLLVKLKPMVKYHLPFATVDETVYRAMSMYLLAQYFLYKRGYTPDWELKHLYEAYNNIRIVNNNFCKRLNAIAIQDASLNAIVTLDIFATYINFSIEGSMVENIEHLFKPYFE